MCGIAGAIARDTATVGSTVRSMRDTLTHRGPDGDGFREWADHGVALGHRRLAIIDPSPAGANPLGNEDGSVWIVFNGEVCNFQSLRTELQQLGHVFRTRTDTEVVVHAYEEWGDAHVHRLRGFFAYALYDRRRPAPRLVLVRDRIGVKPLYYSVAGERLVFGSEIKAVIADPAVSRVVDRSAIFDYFTYSCIPSPKTAYRDVRALEPGHMLVHDGSTAAITRYWDVRFDRARDALEHKTRVGAAVTEAVKLYLVSDEPIGAWLSGGIDSSVVAALMAQSRSRVPTFTLAFDTPERNETPYAAIVAAACGTDHHETHIDGRDLHTLPAAMLAIYDQPFADGSSVPTWRLAQAASRSVKVVLSGDGGDEVFGGYNRYWKWSGANPVSARARLRSGMRRLAAALIGSGGSPFEGFNGYARMLELFTPPEKRRLLSPEWAREFHDYDDYWCYRRYWRPELEPLARLQYLDLKTYLPDDILTKVDGASMAASLEVRPPLIDHLVVEAALSLPDAIRVPDHEAKALLKSLARDLLPESIVNRAKQGFSAPWTAWMAREQAWATGELAPATPGLFRHNLAADPSIGRYGEKVWAALLAAKWLGAQP